MATANLLIPQYMKSIGVCWHINEQLRIGNVVLVEMRAYHAINVLLRQTRFIQFVCKLIDFIVFLQQ